MRLNPPPANLIPGSSVWAYLRDSGGPTQQDSIAQQREKIEAYAGAHQLAILRVFEDVHKSGSSTRHRSAFDEMISLSASPALRPAALLIWNFARFARDVDDSQLYKAILRNRGILIHSLTDNIPEGQYALIIEDIIHIADQHKREEAAYGAWRGLQNLVRQGGVPGRPPRGFRREAIHVHNEEGASRVAHRWSPDPDLVPIIRKAFEMRAARVPLREIHAQTHLLGSINSYVTFFKNPIYIGRLEYGELIFENYCEPIVPPAIWEAVQIVLRENADQQRLATPANHPRRQIATYLLSGLAHCARCGSPLSGYTSNQINGAPYLRYACTRARRRGDCDLQPIPAKFAEAKVIETLDLFLSDVKTYHETLTAIQHDRAARAAQLADEAASLTFRLASVRRAIANLQSAIEQQPSRSLLTRLAQREAEQLTLQAESVKIKTHINTPFILPTMEQLQHTLPLLRARLHAQSPTELKQTLRDLIHIIHLDRSADTLLGVVTYYHKEHPPDAFASMSRDPVGALTYTRKLTFSAPIQKRRPRQ